MQSRPPLAAYLALAAICFFWGTVYLGIRIALEYFPPMLLMGGRFFYAGLATLLAGAALRTQMPSPREFAVTAFNGIITLGLGIGTLAFAEQWVPSGLAAVLTTTTPFWMMGVAALFPGRERPNLATLFGVLIGLAGTLLLVVPTFWLGVKLTGLGAKLTDYSKSVEMEWDKKDSNNLQADLFE